MAIVYNDATNDIYVKAAKLIEDECEKVILDDDGIKNKAAAKFLLFSRVINLLVVRHFGIVMSLSDKIQRDREQSGEAPK